MIFDIDNWKEIGATLARNKTRTFLTAFGIFWGTAMLALLMGGSKGLLDTLSANFEGFASNSAITYPRPTTMPYKGYAKGLYWNYTTTDIDNIRRCVPELEVVSPIVSQPVDLQYGTKMFSTQIQGIEPNYAKVMSPIIAEGRFLNEPDLGTEQKVCVLGINTANQLFGNESPIGKYVQAGNVQYKVVGIMKQRSNIQIGQKLDDSMVVPLSTLRRTYNMGNVIHYMTLIAKDGYTPTQLRPAIYRALRISHPLHPQDENNMFFMDISKEFERVNNVFAAVNFLILFVGLSSLIAGIIGVGNIMWIVVKERTQEFGIRRALGAKPHTIMEQIMAESAVLTSIAGTAGICFAVGILAVANMIVPNAMDVGEAHVDFQLTFGSAMWIMCIFLVLGCAAGIIPAIKAMRIKPIEALNDK